MELLINRKTYTPFLNPEEHLLATIPTARGKPNPAERRTKSNSNEVKSNPSIIRNVGDIQRCSLVNPNHARIKRPTIGLSLRFMPSVRICSNIRVYI